MKKLSWILANFLFGVVLLECFLRWFSIAPQVVMLEKGRYRISPNPRIGWEFVPHAQPTDPPIKDRDEVGLSNSLGFRDQEHLIKKAKGSLRIAVLGDSIAFGLRIPKTADIFPQLLEKILKQKHRNIEVLNFAVNGYNTLQEVETLKTKALPFHPDLVLLQYCLNDRSYTSGGILERLFEWNESHDAIRTFRDHPWLLKSAIYRWIRYHPVFEKKVPATSRPDIARYAILRADTVAPTLKELAQMEKTHRFKVLVAVFPMFLPNGFDVDVSQKKEMKETLQLIKDANLDSIDLTPVFRECARKNGVIASDIYHPNEAGHDCAAKALSERLEQALF